MAKGKDPPESDDDGPFETMDSDSLDFLEQVRKGKSRNFVLSVKGNKVRSLLVKKKTIKAVDVKDARGQGYQPVFGVVSGQGANITFEIARSDGFEEVPGGGKTEKLKKFLKAQTGKVFKPEYNLVDTKSVIPFDEDDLQNPLIARFMKLETAIVKVLDKFPDQADTLGQMTSDTRDTLQQEAWDAAKDKIAALESYLKTTLSGGAPTDQAAPPPPPPPSQKVDDLTALAAKLAEALKKLKPLMDKVINTEPNRKGELHATFAQIAGEIKEKQFEQARQNVSDFATLLKSLAAQQAAPSASESLDRMQEFAERRDALEPQLLDAQKADREKAAKLGAVWDYASEQAQADNFENAFKALDRLEQSLAGIVGGTASVMQTESSGTPPSWGQAKDAWETAIETVDRQVAQLQSALRDSGDEELIEIAEFGLNGVTGNFKVPLTAAMMDIEKGQEEAPINRAKKIITEFQQHLANDPRVAACDENPFGVSMSIRSSLEGALQLMEQALA